MEEKLNLPCQCGNGKLIVVDYIGDHYTIGCNSCKDETVMHYTGFDVMMDASIYLSQLNKSIELLNENGEWIRAERFEGEERFKALTEGMKLIHTIEAYEKTYFFQDGANFIEVVHNSVHGDYVVNNYVANDDHSIQLLVEHFFLNALN